MDNNKQTIIFNSSSHNLDKLAKEYYGIFTFLDWLSNTKNPIIQFEEFISIKKTECPDFIIETEKEKIGVEFVLITTPNSMKADKELQKDDTDYLQYDPSIYNEKKKAKPSFITRSKNDEIVSYPIYGDQREYGWAKVAFNRLSEKCSKLDNYKSTNPDIKTFILLLADNLALHKTRDKNKANEYFKKQIYDNIEDIIDKYDYVVLINNFENEGLYVIEPKSLQSTKN
ncbi:MAG: hypothetical protein RAO94_13620 [Candidatus Stygibacter australis]|nr:hypothetical protein [Candidatus Stygibacter australis]